MNTPFRGDIGTAQRAAGIGMTSQRTRDRLVETLAELSPLDPRVLDVMRQVPRHLFVDEALASRAYDNVSCPSATARPSRSP